MEELSQVQSQLQQARNYHDIGGLDKLRQAVRKNDPEALSEAAKQFEAIFIQMMLKSMRQAEDVMVDKDSPFNSEQVKFYRDMHDQQLAVDLASKGSLGLAKMIEQQLGNQAGFVPSSVLRSDANLNSARQVANTQPSSSGYAANISMGTKQSAFASQQDFVQQLLPLANKVAQEFDLDPRAMIAQAAVETGWGQYMIHSRQGTNGHNLFGIKADQRWQGDRTLVNTLEYADGQAKQQKAQFRAYGSFEDSMRDYAAFVHQDSRYAEAVASGQQPAEYFNRLQQAGYATDPDYANKVMSVMDSNTFKQAVQGL
ncbi:flagellar assembly peptidoglycan hydrolase FlgJ [Neptunicella sp. SCSIO 80796]|uniref:flagellar assembly peptidoglycan hydrolase FlgJ n=1 Tax=Neptunicella plasticusilytica TaxID=3117012 RepID=UPI003A4D5292